MEFVFNILIILLLAPIAYVVAYLRYGKISKALYVLLMSPYMLIPFIWLSIATQWQIGVASLLAYGVIGFRLNLYCISCSLKAADKAPDKELEQAVVKKAADLTGSFAEMGSGRFSAIKMTFQTALHIASAY